MENSTPGPTGASTRKRKRIPIACSSCRARKSRCDGVRPQCSACVEQGIECIYAANSGGSNALVPKQYLEQVEHRLADVEEEISRLKRLIPASFLQGKQHVLFPRSVSGRTDDISEVNYPEESLNVEDGSVTQGITPDATDGVGTIEFTTDESWAYFGPSSNIAFTRIIRRTLDHLLNKTQKDERGDASSTPAKHAQQHILAVSRSQSPVTDSFDSRKLEKPSEALRLPLEEEVINLVRQFFRDTGLLFPYIHEESFWKAYAQYRETGMQNAKTAWLALLHMVLAMATSTMNATGVGLSDRQAISEVHYRRAKALSMTEMMTGANVEAAFNASLTIVATKLVEDSYGSMPFDQGYTNTAIRLDDILKSAVSCITRLDIQNPMVEKCAKFTATLIFMIQSLQMTPGRDDIAREVGGMRPSHAIPSNGGENAQSTHISANSGMDDAFSNLMNYLPPNFNDFPNTGANFSMSELMDDFTTGDLFW
ncbi:fungal specific transcription factor domain-containing protein [Colletotrichum costaricense]|uniref:Fungal specific transcription factor domain-containing protein n=1 Tax=Colletotrichum costaricense TaxID=1209916 RepID=A0AAI9YMG0_9PEZI|nr:fungal specific transcription factor domain-containing protein [Colletotrichum costaricense]KAK1515634.1 fungal specific transcription factor domain-containing protein [Colletotrichum costaricense]